MPEIRPPAGPPIFDTTPSARTLTRLSPGAQLAQAQPVETGQAVRCPDRAREPL
jgi:hypothetical protein